MRNKKRVIISAFVGMAIIYCMVIFSVIYLKVTHFNTIYNSDVLKISRYTNGYEEFPEGIDSSYFWEYVYVYNLPQDTLTQLKLMLSYADSITLGFQTVREMKDLQSYHVIFYERRTIKNKSSLLWFKIWTGKSEKYRIGSVVFGKECDNPTRWYLSVEQRESSSNFDGDHSFTIFNECYTPNENNWGTVRRELVNYYKELRDKRAGK
jgi:hypothetical protein